MVDIKYEQLKNYIKHLGSAAVAFSGGVDSVFLLKTAKEVLGDNVIAVTVKSKSVPQREVEEAKIFCDNENIRFIIRELNEFEMDGFCDNNPDRCYICKKAIFTEIINAAKKYGINNIIEGSNLDDEGDYRPGMRALKDLGVKSPLREIGYTKSEIRRMSEKLGLKAWNKPSFACLATRIPYGDKITPQKLEKVDKAEQMLIDNGFIQPRVRVHDNIARIEIKKDEFDKLINMREEVYKQFRDFGFDYVTMDLLGYRTGSMNETLK